MNQSEEIIRDLCTAKGLLTAYATVLAERDALSGKRSRICDEARSGAMAISRAVSHIERLAGEYKLLEQSKTVRTDRAEGEILALRRELLECRTRENGLKEQIRAMREERGDTVIATPCVPQYGAGTGSQEGNDHA